VPTLHASIAAGVFLVTLAAVITRPWKLPEAWSAAAGALLMLVVGVVGPGSALGAVAARWDLFLFLAGLMLIAGLADAAGFFDAAGALAAAAARGSGRLLLLSVFVVGALLTAFLSNDATALILTPVVCSIVTRLGLPPLPYLFATTFVADTASVLLPVSNPINIVVVSYLRLPLAGYLAHLLPAAVIVVLINAGAFLLIFRRQLGSRFEIDWRSAMGEAAPHRRHLLLASASLLAIACGYLAASALGASLGAVAVAGGVLLGLVALACGRLRPARVREHVSLSLLLYVAGLTVLVRGLQDAGVTAAVVSGLFRLATGPGAAVAAGALGAAGSANLVNNWPATLFLLSGAQVAHLSGHLATPFGLGVLAGADLGPNLTPVGSLSTMLWLVIVRRRGIEVSALDYLKLGALVTPPMLLAAWLAIAVTFR
jgi:arsenical pump membrane protein